MGTIKGKVTTATGPFAKVEAHMQAPGSAALRNPPEACGAGRGWCALEIGVVELEGPGRIELVEVGRLHVAPPAAELVRAHQRHKLSQRQAQPLRHRAQLSRGVLCCTHARTGAQSTLASTSAESVYIFLPPFLPLYSGARSALLVCILFKLHPQCLQRMCLI